MSRPRPLVWLSERHVAKLSDVRSAIRSAQAACIALARGQAAMPPKLYLPLPGGNDFRAMPAWQAHPPMCGVKWVNVHPRNPRRGLPSVMAVILLNDPATGEPLAGLEGGLVTKLRTAAAAAVAARALARPGSRRVALVGCGAQADAQLEALAAVLPVRAARVWGRRPGEAARFCRRMRRRLPRVRLSAAPAIESCVRDADVIVTLTPSRRPLVRRGWVRAGAHINAIGADAPGKQELDPRLLQDAVVVVDDRAQALHAGELNVPVRRGQFRAGRIRATLGEILTGRRPGRRRDEEITVFDSTGLAVHDLALAAQILRRALREGVGRRVPLRAS
jgi:alanine dehydrogenase